MKVQVKPLRICFGLVSIVLILYCSFVLYRTLTYSFSNKPTRMSEAEFFGLINLTYGMRRVLERIEQSDGSIVSVCDIIRIKDGRFYVFRIAEADLGFHTTISLKTPSELTLDNINTGKWKIDRTLLLANTSLHTMVGSILRYSATTLTRNTEAKILSIGLGGGAINSLLRNFFPKMDITVVEYNAKMIYMAKKWFGLELDKRQRVVLADGIKFMAKKVDQGSIYDMIILDACDGGFVSTTLICPAAGFLDNAVIENAARLAGPRGTLFLNALSMRLSNEELEQFMMSRLQKSFNHCTMQRPSATMNQIYSCSQRHLDGKEVEMTKFINVTLL